jgi:hypothetical protein
MRSRDDAFLESAYERYRIQVDTVALRAQRPAPSTYAEAVDIDLPDILRNGARPNGDATKLDVFLRLRGLERHADALYQMGARTVNDLAFLEDDDFDAIGLAKADVRVHVQ